MRTWRAIAVALVLLAGCTTESARAPRTSLAPTLAVRAVPFAELAAPRRAPRPILDRSAVEEVPLALAPLNRASSEARPPGAPRLYWPTDGGTVSSQYGRRGRRHHDGIDISVRYGAPVYAAAAGEVVYAGSLRGYGRMIIIRHARGFVTVYAHNARHDVVAGRRVKHGELIARVGRTGRTTGVNLHFEVRKDNIAYDPLVFLPPRPDAVARGE
ncbi:MAG: M23 family metallopeptidase [bacterium]